MHDTTRALPQVDAPKRGVALVVIEGSDAGRSVRVAPGTLVGCSESCALELTDRTVSRRHVQVDPAPLGARVRDLGSKNGTWLGDAQVHDVELTPDTIIRIGGTRLRLELHDEEPAPRVAPVLVERFGRFLGSSMVLQPMYAKLLPAAATDIGVLIEGESGTGKELLAEAIHEHSPRADGPFVVVDCGAVPETLIESELFGHEAGAFTGATHQHIGAFERAHGGTVFLDEVGEIPLAMQTRLLRVLDKREIRRLGGSDRMAVDIRVVAATNRDLDREVEENRFRLDLFHRLAVVLVRVPPLRDRGHDIEAIARHLIDARGGTQDALTPRILGRLGDHRWPGNVRELRNYVERLVLLGEDSEPLVVVPDLDASTGDGLAAARAGLPYRQARAMVLEAFTAAFVEDMLARHDGNVSHAAKAAGIARRHFQRLKK